MADTEKPAAEAQHTSSVADQLRLREAKAQELAKRGVQPWGNQVRSADGTAVVKSRHAC